MPKNVLRHYDSQIRIGRSLTSRVQTSSQFPKVWSRSLTRAFKELEWRGKRDFTVVTGTGRNENFDCIWLSIYSHCHFAKLHYPAPGLGHTARTSPRVAAVAATEEETTRHWQEDQTGQGIHPAQRSNQPRACEAASEFWLDFMPLGHHVSPWVDPFTTSFPGSFISRPGTGAGGERAWERGWSFHFQEWSIPNFPCSLTRNITSHSMENVAFHSLHGRLLHYQFSLGECTFLNLDVNTCIQYAVSDRTRESGPSESAMLRLRFVWRYNKSTENRKTGAGKRMTMIATKVDDDGVGGDNSDDADNNGVDDGAGDDDGDGDHDHDMMMMMTMMTMTITVTMTTMTTMTMMIMMLASFFPQEQRLSPGVCKRFVRRASNFRFVNSQLDGRRYRAQYPQTCWRRDRLDSCYQAFHSHERSISNLPCSLTRHITSQGMKNLTFHSLLRWKVILLWPLTTPPIQFSSKRVKPARNFTNLCYGLCCASRRASPQFSRVFLASFITP